MEASLCAKGPEERYGSGEAKNEEDSPEDGNADEEKPEKGSDEKGSVSDSGSYRFLLSPTP